MKDEQKKVTRRDFIGTAARGGILVALGGVGLFRIRSGRDNRVWQIDPYKCIQCGNCKDYCVLKPSAVKCVHAIESLCGYCEPCFGYFDPNATEQNTGAENLMCPVDAIRRRHVNGPNYEYTIDEGKCVACARCAKGCNTHGNGSLYMQVRHDRCLNCSQCSIAVACPSGAFVRVPASDPYMLKPRKARG